MKKTKLLIAVTAMAALATASMSVAEWLPTMKSRAGKFPFRWCVRRNISNRNDTVTIDGQKQNAFNMMVSGKSDQEIMNAFKQPVCPANTSLDFWITRNDNDPMRVACCMDCPLKPNDKTACPNSSAPARSPLDKNVFCCPALR